MKLSLLILSILSLCSCSVTQPQESFNGTYVIQNYLPTRGFSGITYEEASEYKGTEIVYNKELAQFGNAFCKSPTYKINTIDDDAFFQLTRNSLSNLGLHGNIAYEVSLTCGSKSDNWLYGTNLFLNSSDRVIFLIEGVWMEAFRK